jgi:hypothetical protein
MLYNYWFYLFGSAMNLFLPVYAALVALSIFALVFVLTSVDAAAIVWVGVPARWIAAFMLLFSLFIGSLWIAGWLRFVMTGRIPQLGGTGEAFRLVAALDLTLQVPFLAVGALWLWKRQPWGYVVAAMWMTADAVYMIVLLAFSPFAAKAGVPGAWDQAPMWAVAGTGCLASSILLLRNLRT